MKASAFFITLFSLILISAGCASVAPAPEKLRTETRGGGGIKIVSAQFLPEKSGLRVHGVVEAGLGYYGSPFRHVDVEIISPTGELLATQAVEFFPNPILHSRFGLARATYTAMFAAMPPDGSLVRVSIDCATVKHCTLKNRQPFGIVEK